MRSQKTLRHHKRNTNKLSNRLKDHQPNDAASQDEGFDVNGCTDAVQFV